MNTQPIKLVFAFATIACSVALIVLSILPANEMVRTGMPKVIEHFGAYGGTAFLASLSLLRRWSFVPSAVVFILAAGMLEYAQNWSPGRDAGWNTFIASAFGAAIGLAAARAAISLRDTWVRRSVQRRLLTQQ